MLSIFPKDVAIAVQRDLKDGHNTEQDSSLQFRKLYINRFENVRYATRIITSKNTTYPENLVINKIGIHVCDHKWNHQNE